MMLKWKRTHQHVLVCPWRSARRLQPPVSFFMWIETMSQQLTRHPSTCLHLTPPLPVPLSAPSPQKVLVKVANLTASFEVLAGNVTAIFSWNLSRVSLRQQLTGYQVTWAEVIPSNHRSNNKLPHSLISQSQILPPVSTTINYSG